MPRPKNGTQKRRNPRSKARGQRLHGCLEADGFDNLSEQFECGCDAEAHHCGAPSESSSQCLDEVDAEARHFRDVCIAFQNYSIDALKEVARIEADFNTLSSDDLALLAETPSARVASIKQAIAVNQKFINLILAGQWDFQSHQQSNPHQEYGTEVRPDSSAVLNPAMPPSSSPPRASDPSCVGNAPKRLASWPEDAPSSHNQKGGENHTVANDFRPPATLLRNIPKVRSTLRQFIRDWSVEGELERRQAYDPLLDALEQWLPLEPFLERHKRVPRILCPGSGLGRLPLEVVKRGYGCQGNEFSYFMLLGSNMVLNNHLPLRSCAIRPYCLGTSNRLGNSDHLREVLIPDIDPTEAVKDGQDFSMCAGEFVEAYWPQEAEWDGVLTCFFLDTAKNIIQYIRTIARVLKPGAIWANLGPLLYHFSGVPREVSIELAWEELRVIISRWFSIKQQRMVDAHYTTDPLSLMQVVYHSIFFVAVRNTAPMIGESTPVYT